MTLYASLPYLATWSESSCLVGCWWRRQECRINHPASVKGSWRSLCGGSQSQCQCCGSVQTYSTRYGLKPIPLNILTTTHPTNHTDCHLHHQHTLRNTHPHRLTFNRNVVKLLDFVLEWQNPYSVTVNVIVPLHNVTYLRIWLLVEGWMCVCSCVSRMVSVSTTSTGERG